MTHVTGAHRFLPRGFLASSAAVQARTLGSQASLVLHFLPLLVL
jgi:hypothetical protein